jgi:molecular chaperone DnaK
MTSVYPPVHYIDLQYDPVGWDPEPVISGQVMRPGQESLDGYSIEFCNTTSQPAWHSRRIRLDSKGRFMTCLFAMRGTQNTFKIVLTDQSRRVIPTEPGFFHYWLTVGSPTPPLIHSIGIALPHNEVKWFLEKGTTPPIRKRHNVYTSHDIPCDAATESLYYSVIEGSSPRADRNRVIGSLTVPINAFRRDVSAGAEIEITITMDIQKILTASVYIPLLDQEFENVLVLGKPVVDTDFLRKELRRERKRLDEVRQRTVQLNDQDSLDYLQKIDSGNMLDAVLRALKASKGDPDAADKTLNLLLDLKIAIDQVEDLLKISALLKDAEEKIKRSREGIDQFGDTGNKSHFDQLEDELRHAIQNRQVDLIRSKVDEIDNLVINLLRDKPEFWVGSFHYLEQRQQSMTDQAQAHLLFTQGHQAVRENDLPHLKVCIQRLLALLPQDNPWIIEI